MFRWDEETTAYLDELFAWHAEYTEELWTPKVPTKIVAQPKVSQSPFILLKKCENKTKEEDRLRHPFIKRPTSSP